MQRAGRGFVLSLMEQARGGVAMPAVRVREVATSSCGGRAPSFGSGRVVASGTMRKRRPRSLPELRSRCCLSDSGSDHGMLDHLAIHVADPEAAVGRVGEGDGPEPVVACSRQIRCVPRRGARSARDCNIAAELFAMDEIAAAIRDEHIAAKLRRPGVAAIDRHAAWRR